ncbi:hypothetical protein RND81_12G125000 [Saponaria officinalis]|uniref:Uncharacterized protein n=1 Tax=Saponaria officinalis TaxID=3572 RepID=A0AAW1H9R1_SAPOF
MSAKSKEVTAKARSGDCYFSVTEVLAKHDEKYMPQEVRLLLRRARRSLTRRLRQPQKRRRPSLPEFVRNDISIVCFREHHSCGIEYALGCDV